MREVHTHAEIIDGALRARTLLVTHGHTVHCYDKSATELSLCATVNCK
jgi:hypothetical protein